VAQRKLRKADLVRLAVSNARGPRELEESGDPMKMPCGRRGCEEIIDRSKPRAAHQVYCSPRCRKIAYDERRALEQRAWRGAS
jgi:hypothetical protein